MCFGKKSGSGKSCCWGTIIGWILVLVGGINWGLVGIGILAGGNWNVINLIFGRVGQNVAWLEAIIYLLVGLSALMIIIGCYCKKCESGSCKDGSCSGGEMSPDNNSEPRQDRGDN